MDYWIDIQHACNTALPITDETIKKWVSNTLALHMNKAELTIRFVEPDEITTLNSTYRKKNKPTNVLAFNADIPNHVNLDYPLLGDVIICPIVLYKESLEENIPLEAHFAHIVIHGVLHLLGYDHIYEEDSLKMRQLEITLLQNLGYDDPYRNKEKPDE